MKQQKEVGDRKSLLALTLFSEIFLYFSFLLCHSCTIQCTQRSFSFLFTPLFLIPLLCSLCPLSLKRLLLLSPPIPAAAPRATQHPLGGGGDNGGKALPSTVRRYPLRCVDAGPGGPVRNGVDDIGRRGQPPSRTHCHRGYRCKFQVQENNGRQIRTIEKERINE